MCIESTLEYLILGIFKLRWLSELSLVLVLFSSDNLFTFRQFVLMVKKLRRSKNNSGLVLFYNMSSWENDTR